MKFWLQSYTKYSTFPTHCTKIIIQQSIFLSARNGKRVKKTIFFAFFRFILQQNYDFFCNFAARKPQKGSLGV